MKKIILFLTIVLFTFSFGDILLDRMKTEPQEVCPIGKKHRKRFFLLEIRQVKNKAFLYLFEKNSSMLMITNKYKFIYGFNLDFLGKEVYFEGYKEYRTNDFKKTYLYWCKPKTKYESGNFLFLIGGKLSKNQVNNYIKNERIEEKRTNIYRWKNGFYGMGRMLLFIPENKTRKAFFTTLKTQFSSNPMKWLATALKNKYMFTIPAVQNYLVRGPFTLTLNSYSKGEFNKVIGFSPKQKSFRDKYYFNLADLKKKGIPEPKPMWDSKVKPYKNVFGEELVD